METTARTTTVAALAFVLGAVPGLVNAQSSQKPSGRSSARPQPRACLSMDQESPPVGLPYGGGSVIFEKAHIVHRQQMYYVKVFSDTAPKQRFEQCFRYEVESEGAENIKPFSWELAGMWYETLIPQKRRSRVLVRPVDDDPRKILSRVFAFENDWAEVNSYGPLARQRADSWRNSPTSAEFYTVAPDNALTGLEGFLRSRNRSPQLLTGLFLKSTNDQAPILEDVYSGPNVRIEVRSSARRERDQIILTTEMFVRGNVQPEARYRMPALLALTSLDKKPNLDTYAEFLNRYDAARRESSRRPGGQFIVSVPASTLPRGLVYLMLHPIAIEAGGERACFLAASYAPLALSFQIKDCAALFAETKG